MNVGSLFSGIGGIEIGFEQAGFNTAWFVEREPYAKEILRKRFPEAHIYDDVTEIDWRTVPKVDILTGGFPCQDISNAGARAGIEGNRSSLWKHYLEAISVLRPRVAFIENVAALLGRGLSTVLCDLASVGYDAEWYCVPASAVGAHHQRDRIFILAYTDNYGSRPNYGANKEATAEVWGKEKGNVSMQYGEDVPDTTTKRLYDKENKQELERKRSSELQSGKSRSYADVPDTNSRGLERASSKRWNKWDALRTPDYGWWAVEPDLGRVAYGVPNRVDRIKCLGNAVVPQVAEVFAWAIKEIVKGDSL